MQQYIFIHTFATLSGSILCQIHSNFFCNPSNIRQTPINSTLKVLDYAFCYQVEVHPYNPNTKLVEFCHERGIAVTAFSPLGSPDPRRSRQVRPKFAYYVFWASGFHQCIILLAYSTETVLKEERGKKGKRYSTSLLPAKVTFRLIK